VFRSSIPVVALAGKQAVGVTAVIAGMDIGTVTTRVAVRDEDGTVVVLSPDAQASTGDRAAPSLLSVASEPQAARPRSDVPSGLLSGLRTPDGVTLEELPETGDGVVAAVPDDWFDGSLGGALAREVLRGVLLEKLGIPLHRFVGHSQAAAATLAERSDADLALVCDVGAHTLSAALCRLGDGAARVLDVETAGGPVSPHAGTGFDRCALRAADREDADSPDPEDTVLLHAFHDAKRREHRRAVVLLPRAEALERYGSAPVYRFTAQERGYVLTAGEVMRCFSPVREAIRETVGRLVARHPDAAQSPPFLAIAGGFGAFPMVGDVVLDALPSAWRRTAPVVVGEDAVARGALLLAEGRADASAPYPHTLRLPVRRLHGGHLETVRVEVAEAGAPAPMLAEEDGEAVVVEVLPSHGLRLTVEVLEHGRGEYRTLALTQISLPAGHFQVGLWPARTGFGALVLRPVTGGEPVVCPLEETAPSSTKEGDR
jgi:hypothetical protein